MNGFFKVLTLSFLMVAGGSAAYMAIDRTSAGGTRSMEPPTVTIERTPIQRDPQFATSFAHIVEEAAPSVVYVFTTRTVREMPRGVDPFEELFRHFRGHPGRREQPERTPRERQQQGLGSGVIVSENGYILTNNHVVDGADEIRVMMADGGQEYVARVVGTDPATDIALLKIEAADLPAITITDSDDLRVGDIVLAIGNPFGVGQTVTMGIVSATGRGLGMMDLEDFIQTDAAINVGNSGGALVDVEGRLVGINTAIISRAGGSVGIGFAVPINMARTVMDRLITDGRVVRGFLGVGIQRVTPDLAKALDLPGLNGALVGDVHPNTPASKAGLQEGDLIVEFDGRKVTDNRHLRLMVSQTRPGSTVPLTVIREGERHVVEVVLGELEPETLAQLDSRERGEPVRLGVLEGVEVSDITSRWRQQFQIPQAIQGALVMNVRTDSPAYAAGLRPGDVILEINRQAISGAGEAVSVSRQMQQDRVLLRVWSRDQRGSRFLVVDTSRPG